MNINFRCRPEVLPV